MKFYLLSALLVVMAFHPCARAKDGSCPNGYYPIGSQGVMGCASIPGYNQQQQQNAPKVPALQWESSWGAIATDEPHGIVGSSSGLVSASKAENSAVDDCKSKGGSDCKLQLSYSNGCGALLVGDKTFNLNWGSTEEVAIQKAMTVCKASDTGCHVYFTSCSMPKLHQ